MTAPTTSLYVIFIVFSLAIVYGEATRRVILTAYIYNQAHRDRFQKLARRAITQWNSRQTYDQFALSRRSKTRRLSRQHVDELDSGARSDVGKSVESQSAVKSKFKFHMTPYNFSYCFAFSISVWPFVGQSLNASTTSSSASYVHRRISSMIFGNISE